MVRLQSAIRDTMRVVSHVRRECKARSGVWVVQACRRSALEWQAFAAAACGAPTLRQFETGKSPATLL